MSYHSLDALQVPGSSEAPDPAEILQMSFTVLHFSPNFCGHWGYRVAVPNYSSPLRARKPAAPLLWYTVLLQPQRTPSSKSR